MVSARTTRAMTCLCSVTVLLICKSDQFKAPCSTDRIKDTFAVQLKCLQKASRRAGNVTSPWSDNLIADLLDSARTLASMLEQQQLKFCKFDFPNENPDALTPSKSCPFPNVHKNGGLACVTVKQTHYCKPMCNEGYDFSFLRTSRLYEQCSEDTGYKWTTQYIGGNRLAECIESPIQVSGSVTAYFPPEQDCLKTGKTDKNGVIGQLARELETDQTEIENACLVCG